MVFGADRNILCMVYVLCFTAAGLQPRRWPWLLAPWRTAYHSPRRAPPAALLQPPRQLLVQQGILVLLLEAAREEASGARRATRARPHPLQLPWNFWMWGR
jgi:hypothetical protein